MPHVFLVGSGATPASKQHTSGLRPSTCNAGTAAQECNFTCGRTGRFLAGGRDRRRTAMRETAALLQNRGFVASGTHGFSQRAVLSQGPEVLQFYATGPLNHCRLAAWSR